MGAKKAGKEGKETGRRSDFPSLLSLNRRLLIRPLVLRKAVSPACPSRQGRSPAVAPVGPICGPGVSSGKNEDRKDRQKAASASPERNTPIQLMKVDPRALKDNPDNTRQSKSTPQADALLLATIKAVGVIQPPVIFAEAGGNGYVIEAGHRRTRLVIAAAIEEMDVIVVEAANDNGAMRLMIENIAREPLNPVDQWRGIARLVALGWTEEAIAIALALPVRQNRSASFACWPMYCRRCSTCRTSSSCAQFPQRRSMSRRKSGRPTSRRRVTRRPGGRSETASPRPACLPAMRVSATIFARPMASSGRKTCSDQPTRITANRRTSKHSSVRSRSG